MYSMRHQSVPEMQLYYKGKHSHGNIFMFYEETYMLSRSIVKIEYANTDALTVDLNMNCIEKVMIESADAVETFMRGPYIAMHYDKSRNRHV